MKELPSAYNPHGMEKKWYPVWEENGHFSWKKKFPEHEKWSKEKIEELKKTGRVYSIVIPPPNVTGSLHLGHALNHTIQDILIRYNRMKGKVVLWVPGTDHAGIATQNVVEKLLAKEGKKRWEMSREEFEKRVWEWKAESGGIITHQQRELGESVDWDYERFTLDEGLSETVKDVFIQLYNEKLIYRGERIINWCPHDKTALSNIEVDYKNQKGHFYHIQYKLKNPSSGREMVTIATTRPETMLGDEALAVHPSDERYKNLVGEVVIIPLIDKEIPVIADEYVDPEFGTGIVKITPAHDPNDFEVGKRHNLPNTRIMDDAGVINENGKQYQGTSREAARKKIIEDLEQINQLEKIEDITHAVGHCYRCDTVVEPIVSLQWFVDVKPLAEKSIDAVRKEKIRFIPKRWENTYFEWMENIQDWCISRQLWWGHRIPAYYCEACGHVMVDREMPEKCEKCASANIRRDEDVLDTWFSSGLWPFSTLMKENQKSADLDLFYPTSVLVTGFDIIFFWVARMIMFGLHFQKDIPFKDVFIHGLVRDAERKKMSKSKGNVVNPLEKMEEYGTDAFRFFLTSIMPEGKDIVYDESRLKGYSSFANKIWNTARFIWMNQSESYTLPETVPEFSENDQWILSHFNRALKDTQNAIENYRFGDYSRVVYDFLWKFFCDHYIELSKVKLVEEKEKNIAEENSSTLFVLNFVFTETLKLLHPVMPFLTEELYSYWNWSKNGNDKNNLIIDAEWPLPAFSDKIQKEKVDSVETMLDVLYQIRNLRGELSIAPKEKFNLYLYANEKVSSFLKKNSVVFQKSGGVQEVNAVELNTTVRGYKALFKEGFIIADIHHLVDVEQVKSKLQKDLKNKESYLKKVNAKLSNEKFTSNAPDQVIHEEKEKASSAEQTIAEIKTALELL